MNDAFCMVIMWVTGNVQNVHYYAINVKGVVGFEALTDSMVFIDKKGEGGEKWEILLLKKAYPRNSGGTLQLHISLNLYSIC